MPSIPKVCGSAFYHAKPKFMLSLHFIVSNRLVFNFFPVEMAFQQYSESVAF